MAGDWIKMRVWLSRDPKVIAMAQHLAFDRAFMDWLTTPTRQKCDESALEHVTLNVVTRCVTCALLQVWGVANERGKVVGSDLVLHYASKLTVDEIAELPSFGDAMESVGWLKVSGKNESITFPDFMTYNVPAEDRARQLATERQRKFRRDKSRDSSVTVTSRALRKSNARSESDSDPIRSEWFGIECLQHAAQTTIESKPAGPKMRRSAFASIDEHHLEDTGAMVEWHQRQLSVDQPIVGATEAELILVIASGLTAAKMSARSVKKSRVAVFVGTVKANSWKSVLGYVEEAHQRLEEFKSHQLKDPANGEHTDAPVGADA